MKKNISKKLKSRNVNPRNFPRLQLKDKSEISLDFATKAYQKFDKIIKSIILFGSTVKQNSVAGSDIDIIIIVDDASINWDAELIAWYREELGKIIQINPYKKECLLKGLDDIDYLLNIREVITAFETR